MLNILIKKIRRNLIDYGFFITIKKMLLYPCMNIYKSKNYLIYRKDLVGYKPTNKNNPSYKYVFLEIESIDENILQQLFLMEEWLIERIDFIKKNHGLCLVALDGPVVAGFNIVSFNEVYMPLIELTRKFKNYQAWSEQISVKKDYRKHGLGSLLRYKMFNELKARGCRTFYGGTMADNISNIELSKKVGFDIFLNIHFRRFLNRKKYVFVRIYSNMI